MAVITPPLFQNVDGAYTAALLGVPYRDIIGEGVVAAGDLAVAQRSAGANMSVDVAAGVAWIKGDESVLQPTYRAYNDATVNLAIAAADASNPRIDIVIAEVRDAVFSGVSTDWRLQVVTGTPAASPTVPTTPNNALKLADVSVPALDTTVGTAQITDRRVRAQLGAGLAVAPLVTALPTTPYDGQEIRYLANATNGIVWNFIYRAASASAYKWEFIGGSPLTAEDATNTVTGSTSYGAGTGAVGPTVTVPLEGDYGVSFGAVTFAAAASILALTALKRGAAATSDTDAIRHGHDSISNEEPGSRTIPRLAGIAAGAELKMEYRITASTATFKNRWMSVAPIRVG